jgi:tRNA G10  N-methylase Trm11
MLWGCKKNLDCYGAKADISEGDATQIKLKNVDAIVTDPPYARASKMFDSELEELYDKFLESSFKALKPNGFLVLSVPTDATLAYARVGFEAAGEHELYVHKSLTRKVYILKKPNQANEH